MYLRETGHKGTWLEVFLERQDRETVMDTGKEKDMDSDVDTY